MNELDRAHIGPIAGALRGYVVAELSRYWERTAEPIQKLTIPVSLPQHEDLPPRVSPVTLPDWAKAVGIDGALYVPESCIQCGDGPRWARTDWLGAAFWFMNGCAERAFELRHGPIHSYSFRLTGWNPIIWNRAWVNRIALFLRMWAAREQGRDETDLLGALPDPEVVVTHDVDAVYKTWSIRAKQGAFRVLNGVRAVARLEVPEAATAVLAGARFVLSPGQYFRFDEIRGLERKIGIRSQFNVYAGDQRRRSLRQSLLDPGYDIGDGRLSATLRQLRAEGCEIGLHQSYDAWRDSATMLREKQRLEQSIDGPVSSCRQHWLRFGWLDTWKAQEAAGFSLDTTLGFNDRPGFRNGAAVRFRPWDFETGRSRSIASMPMVLMDSHLYDYASMNPETRVSEIRHWLEEVCETRGSATVIWHVHVLSDDYGWRPGFETLLNLLSRVRTHR